LYKPQLDLAMELLQAAFRPLLTTVTVPLVKALGLVSATEIEAAHWPQQRIAWKDGWALGGSIQVPAHEQILTGQPVPQWAVRVVPDELMKQRPMSAWLETAHLERPEIMAAGREYQAGESLLKPGEIIDRGKKSQLAFLGIDTVAVNPAPPIKVVLFGSAQGAVGNGGNAAVSWLSDLLAEHGVPQPEFATADSLPQVEALARGTSIVFLVSDGAPGRYESLAPMWRHPESPFETIFWKWALYPCKHTGLFRLGSTLVVALPDLASKTMLSAMLLVPAIASAAWNYPCAPPLVLPCPVDVQVESEAARMVPLRLTLRSDGTHVRPLDLDKVWSGRGTCDANAFALLRRSAKAHSDLVKCRVFGHAASMLQ